MFLQHKGSGKEKRVYICRSYRLKRGDKTSTEIVEKLGTLMDIEAAHPGVDPMEWAKARCAELTRLAKEARKPVKVELDPAARVSARKQHPVTGGMIPLMRPFFQWMGIGRICKDIKARHRFKFDFEGIMEALCFGRVLCPDSKVATLESSKSFVTGTDASIEDVYLALSVMAKESTFIQKELYRNTQKAGKRNTGIIYYDCTNYYFEIEKDDSDSYDAKAGAVELGLRKYGHSKEHRPNPIVQCGLFMDADGMPLAFCINPGNTPETQTIIPLEETLADHFDLDTFVCCTDGGLGSREVRKYNKTEGRHYITVQSLKDRKVDPLIQKWALEDGGWRIPGVEGTFTLGQAAERLGGDAFREARLYKDRWFVLADGEEEHIVVTYSKKYADYQKATRLQQVARAARKIERGQSTAPKSPNDCRRFISTVAVTADGELAKKTASVIDQGKIDSEARFDGLHALATSLEGDPLDIIKASSYRAEIESLFRITKTDLSLRPIYLQRKDRIIGHFIVCFIALLMVRRLQKELGGEHSVEKIISELREMRYIYREGAGYIPTFSPSPLKDKFNKLTDSCLDAEIITNKTMRTILKKQR